MLLNINTHTQKLKIIYASLFLLPFSSFAQKINIENDWKFKMGDSLVWKELNHSDESWKKITVLKNWESFGYETYDNCFGWYRKKVIIPSSFKANAEKYGFLSLWIGKIDDVDETYFNGHLVGSTGTLPPKLPSKWPEYRIYNIDAKDILWDKENLIAVRVYDDLGGGGIYEGPHLIVEPMPDEFKKITQFNGKPVETGKIAFEKDMLIAFTSNKEATLNKGITLAFDFPGEVNLYFNNQYIGKSTFAGKHRFFIKTELIKWDSENKISTLIDESSPQGKVYNSKIEIVPTVWRDFIDFNIKGPNTDKFAIGKGFKITSNPQNLSSNTIKGTLLISLISDINKVESSQFKTININKDSKETFEFTCAPNFAGVFKVNYKFIEDSTKDVLTGDVISGIIE